MVFSLAKRVALAILFASTPISFVSADSPPRGHQLINTPHKHGFRYSKSGEPVRRGKRSERYEVRHGDCADSDCGADRIRSEVGIRKRKMKARIGKDIWYGWSFYNESIPAFSNNENLMPVLGQWKMGGDAHPSIKLVYSGDTKTVDIQLDDMRVAANWGRAQKHGHICKLYSLNRMRRKWVDVTINTNFGKDSSGYLRVWVNGKLVCNYAGQVTANTSTKLYPGPNHRRGIFASFSKRWNKRHPNKPKPTMIAYYDEFLVGNSREQVDTRIREASGLRPVD